jgi:hypothetical protein
MSRGMKEKKKKPQRPGSCSYPGLTNCVRRKKSLCAVKCWRLTGGHTVDKGLGRFQGSRVCTFDGLCVDLGIQRLGFTSALSLTH